MGVQVLLDGTVNAIKRLLSLAIGEREFDLAFRIERHDVEPPIGNVWEDIVEVSFRPWSAEVSLVAIAAERSWSLDLGPVSYRVRYSAVGMDTPESYDDEEMMLLWNVKG